MGLICPVCEKPELKIEKDLELGPDGYNDENTLQAARCQSCGATAAAQYAESRRGRSDKFEHSGVLISEDMYLLLTSNIHKCSNPRNHHCICEIHSFYRVTTSDNTIDPFSKIKHNGDSFRIRLENEIG